MCTSRETKRGACTHCKLLKVRCQFLADSQVCIRCESAKHECIPRDRKKRKDAPTQEDLQAKALVQDRTIQALLAQMDEARRKQTLQRLMGDDPMKTPSIRDKISPERAAIAYFRSGEVVASGDDPGADRSFEGFPPRNRPIPPVISGCYLYPPDIIYLFQLYFRHVHPYFSILDPQLHGDPNLLLWKSPFLFTAICATAARYMTERPNLHAKANDFARDAASQALIEDCASVEICQAYLIIAVYPTPHKTYSEDRAWVFIGLAVKMALQLGLNVPGDSPASLEGLNRTRTWLKCFCADLSFSVQSGKIAMIGVDDYIGRTSTEWYRTAAYNQPYDIHLCGYTCLWLVMARWKRDVEEQRSVEARVKLALEVRNELASQARAWLIRSYENLPGYDFPICRYRVNTLRMIAAYLQLVVLCHVFKQELRDDGQANLLHETQILESALQAAFDVLRIVLDDLYPTEFLRYATNCVFLHISFAASFLVNLLRPRFEYHISRDTRHGIISLVGKLIDALSSERVVLDSKHAPAAYSRFLSDLLSKYRGESEPDMRVIQDNLGVDAPILLGLDAYGIDTLDSSSWDNYLHLYPDMDLSFSELFRAENGDQTPAYDQFSRTHFSTSLA
ncbi:unnamed protein product [Mycena citricolor]|uniref:Zn(2)-C6 fungal-type domain-containing protein n=1 Tax=Mycena citricolor TaxID=2018698 RepID=A0AAD2GXI7_9AGAR|nr:unnamed protein product [Mycena citricolor]